MWLSQLIWLMQTLNWTFTRKVLTGELHFKFDFKSPDTQVTEYMIYIWSKNLTTKILSSFAHPYVVSNRYDLRTQESQPIKPLNLKLSLSTAAEFVIQVKHILNFHFWSRRWVGVQQYIPQSFISPSENDHAKVMWFQSSKTHLRKEFFIM